MNKIRIFDIIIVSSIIFAVWFIAEISGIFEVGQNKNIEALIQGIGLVLITILIPIFVVIYTNRNAEFSKVDEQLIVGHILKGSQILEDLLFIFIPTFFWKLIDSDILVLFEEITKGFLNPHTCLLILLGLPIIGIFELLIKVRDAFIWIKGNRYALRFKYLEEFRDKDMFEKIWQDIWVNENLVFQNEDQFLRIFYLRIEQLLKSVVINSYLLINLLNEFINNLGKRDMYNIAIKEDNFLIRLFGYYKIIHEKSYKSKEVFLIDTNYKIEELIKKAQDFFFKNKELIPYMRVLVKHVKKLEDGEGKDLEKLKDYLESLFSIFLPQFFENINNYKNRGSIWKSLFPDRWKITKNNFKGFKNKENLMFGIVWHEFEQWAVPRILTIKEGIDEKMEDLIRYLFPEVDPILWSKILMFRYTPKLPDYKVKPLIERPWNFGMFGRVKVNWESSGKGEKEIWEEYGEEIKKTYELARTLYPEAFLSENLKAYIGELKILKGSYEKDSKEESKRNSLLRIFKGFLNYLKESDQGTLK